MKSWYLFSLLVVLIITSSCNDAAEDFEQHLVGTWESVVFNDFLSLENVDQYIFHQNGTFEQRHFYREVGNPMIVGFSAITRGDYTYNGSTLSYNIKFSAFRPYDEPYVDENLLNVNDQVYNQTFKSELVLQNNNQEILFPSHVVGGDVMVPDMIFFRVN